jgi:hypothetical protein
MEPIVFGIEILTANYGIVGAIDIFALSEAKTKTLTSKY